MKIEIELFGASRDFSDQNSLRLEVNENSTININDLIKINTMHA